MDYQLTTEELESLNASREAYLNSKIELADIIISEQKIKTEKKHSFANCDLAHNEFIEKQKAIHDKYGDCKVNFITGEISANS